MSFQCLSIPSRYEAKRSTQVHFGTADNPPTPPDRANPIKGVVSSSSVQSQEISNASELDQATSSAATHKVQAVTNNGATN